MHMHKGTVMVEDDTARVNECVWGLTSHLTYNRRVFPGNQLQWY